VTTSSLAHEFQEVKEKTVIIKRNLYVWLNSFTSACSESRRYISQVTSLQIDLILMKRSQERAVSGIVLREVTKSKLKDFVLSQF